MMTKFRMTKINVDQFAILSSEAPAASVDINLTLNLRYSIEAKKIAISLLHKFVKDSTPLLILEITCEFEIHPDDWQTATTDGVVTIPRQLLEHFAVQTIGAARGILHCKTESTTFNGFILPPVDATRLIASDLRIPLN